MPATVFEVLYDFEAEDEGELTVSAGELVELMEINPEELPEGWLLVKVKDHTDNGFVPKDYLKELPPASKPAAPAPAPSAAAAASKAPTNNPAKSFVPAAASTNAPAKQPTNNNANNNAGNINPLAKATSAVATNSANANGNSNNASNSVAAKAAMFGQSLKHNNQTQPAAPAPAPLPAPAPAPVSAPPAAAPAAASANNKPFQNNINNNSNNLASKASIFGGQALKHVSTNHAAEPAPTASGVSSTNLTPSPIPAQTAAGVPQPPSAAPSALNSLFGNSTSAATQPPLPPTAPPGSSAGAFQHEQPQQQQPFAQPHKPSGTSLASAAAMAFASNNNSNNAATPATSNVNMSASGSIMKPLTLSNLKLSAESSSNTPFSKTPMSMSPSKAKLLKAAHEVANLTKITTGASKIRGPSLVAAVERDDFEELKKRTDDFFSKLVSSQEETFDAIADMVDALTSKLNESANSSNELVKKLTDLDELIDVERRRWKQQNEAEKNADVLNRSKDLSLSTSGLNTLAGIPTARTSPVGGLVGPSGTPLLFARTGALTPVNVPGGAGASSNAASTKPSFSTSGNFGSSMGFGPSMVGGGGSSSYNPHSMSGGDLGTMYNYH